MESIPYMDIKFYYLRWLLFGVKYTYSVKNVFFVLLDHETITIYNV